MEKVLNVTSVVRKPLLRLARQATKLRPMRIRPEVGRRPREEPCWLRWEHGVLYLNEGAQYAAIDRLGEHGRKRRLIAVVHRQKPRRL